MSSPIPYATLNLNQKLRFFPCKISPPAAAFVKSVLTHQLRATYGIPQGGKPAFKFRAVTFG